MSTSRARVRQIPVPARSAAITFVACFWAAATALDADPMERSVWEGVYAASDALEGQAAFDARCASCHGQGLGGVDTAPPLTGGRFLGDWRGRSLDDLAKRIRTTMPANNPNSLDADTVAKITSYILSRNRFPSGPTPLPRDHALLKRLRFVGAPSDVR